MVLASNRFCTWKFIMVGGLSFFVGGLKYKRQSFNVYDARHNSALLIFAVVVAFVIPDLFNEDGRWQDVSIKYRCFYYYDYHVLCVLVSYAPWCISTLKVTK